MLKEKMSQQELRDWAEEHNVVFALSLPARHLQCLVDPEKQSWLWLYHYGDMTLEDILLKDSDIHNKPDNSYIPIAYKKAAVLFLKKQHNEICSAKKEEEKFLKLLSEKSKESSFLSNNIKTLLKNRAELREHLEPRSKSERASGRVFLDSKRSEIVYKEEKQSWCGDGRWPELRVSLHSGEVRCKCTKGALGKCRLSISALDASLEWLCDETIDHSSLKENLSMPDWTKFLREIDSLINKKNSLTKEIEQAFFGWRISKKKPHLLIPVSVYEQANGRYKQTPIALNTLRKHPSLCTSSTDLEILRLVLAAGTTKNKSRSSFHESLIRQAITMLKGHQYVFLGGHASTPISIEELKLKLILCEDKTTDQTMYKLKVCWNDSTLQSSEILRKIKLSLWAENLIHLEDSKILVSNISIEKQDFIYSILSNDIQFPIKSLPSLFKRLSQIHEIFPVEIPQKYTEDIAPLATICAEIKPDGVLYIHGEIFVNNTGYPVGKGPKIIFQHLNDKVYVYRRDLEKEKHLWNLRNLPYSLDNSDAILAFFSDLELKNETIFFKQNLTRLSKTSLKLDFTQNKDGFLVSGYLAQEWLHMDLEDLLNAVRHKQSFIKVNETNWVLINAELKKHLEDLNDRIIPQKQENLLKKIHYASLFSPVLDTITQPSPPSPKKSSFKGTLRPYQEEAIHWLNHISQWTPGACLADEMGLGKTVQTLAFLSLRKGPHLIIAPTSLLHSWNVHAKTFTPSLRSIVYHGKDRDLSKILNKDIIISSYGMLEELSTSKDAQINYSTLILDEAQALKNHNTKRSKATRRISREFTLALTGTPIENHLGELWSLFYVLAPELLGSQSEFRKKYMLAINEGNKHRLESLRSLIDPFILRRTKNIVAQDLPEKHEIDVLIALSFEERRLYESFQQALKNKIYNKEDKIETLTGLMRLRQITCHPGLIFPELTHSSKLTRAFEIIEELKNNNKNILIFSQFVSFLKYFVDLFTNKGWSYSYLDGSLNAKKRTEEIENFQTGKNQLFLISLKAGGSGLNLYKATEIILLDPWWNPAVEAQAAARAHRIGQTEVVTVYRIIAQNTIEERIRALHKSKQDISNSVLTEQSNTSLEDVLSLL